VPPAQPEAVHSCAAPKLTHLPTTTRHAMSLTRTNQAGQSAQTQITHATQTAVTAGPSHPHRQRPRPHGDGDRTARTRHAAATDRRGPPPPGARRCCCDAGCCCAHKGQRSPPAASEQVASSTRPLATETDPPRPRQAGRGTNRVIGDPNGGRVKKGGEAGKEIGLSGRGPRTCR
jgi:hypothetical protein